MAIPGPQGRRAVDAGRHARADGGGDPRSRPGHRVRAQGALRRSRARCPTASIVVPLGHGAHRACRAPTPRSSPSRRWSPGRSRPPSGWPPRHGISAEVIDLRSLVPLDTAADPRVGRQDRPAVHGRGEPAAVRLGRRDRLDRRRRGLLQPRRADRPDHRPRTSRCRRRRSSRTSRCPRSSGSSRPSGAAWTTPRDGTRRPTTVASSASAGWAGRWPSAWRRRASTSSSTTGRRSRPGRSPADRRARRGHPAEAARGPTSHQHGRDDAAVHDLYDGPDGVARRPRRRTVAVDMSTVLPDTIQVVEPAVRGDGAGILDAPVSGSVASAALGRPDDHGRR